MPVHPQVLLHSFLPLFTAQLVLKPASYPLAMLSPSRGGDMIGKVANRWPSAHHPQAFTLATRGATGSGTWSATPGVRRPKADELVGELVERVAQAKAQARPGKQGPHTVGGAVEAIGKGTPYLVRWLKRRAAR